MNRVSRLALRTLVTVFALSAVVLGAARADAASGCHGDPPPTVPPGGASNLPNVVYIMLDDGGYADFGVYGCEFVEEGSNAACDVQLTCPTDPKESLDDHWLKTPNIDAIADNGIRFTQHYMAPTCSPSRVSLLSGGYQQHQNVRRQLINQQDLQLRGTTSETTALPEMLRQLGYRTGHFGKWHSGFGKDEFRPLSLGFDEACTLLESDAAGNTGHGYCDPLVRDGNDTSWQLVSGYTTEVLFDYAESFVERHAAAGAPFFLQIWPWAPHRDRLFEHCEQPCPPECADPCDPNCPEERNIGCYLDYYSGVVMSSTSRFGAVMAKVDEQIGLLRTKLTELGIADNTLFIVTNDNGGLNEFVDHQINGDFRGYKGEVFEGGVRTAYVADWNDGIPVAERGSDHAGAVMRFEIYPTLAELAGADLDTLDFDGSSFADVFTNPATVRDADTLAWEHQPSTKRFLDQNPTDEYRYNDFAMRRHDWKLVYSHAFDEGTPVEATRFLFDLQQDPSESTDLSGSQPTIIEGLTEDYFDWREKVTVLPMEVNHDLDDIERVGRDMRFFGGGGFARLHERTRHDFADGHFAFTTRLLPAVGSLGATHPRWIAGKTESWELLLQPDGTVTLRAHGTGSDLSAPPETFELTSTATVTEGEWNTVAFDIYGWRNGTSEMRVHVNGQTDDDWASPGVNASSHGIRYLSSNSYRVWIGGGWLPADRLPFLGTMRDVTLRVSGLYPEEVRRFHQGELFMDDFEVGTYDFSTHQIGSWDQLVTNGAQLSVSGASALFGSRGLSIEAENGERGFLSTHTPTAEKRIKASIRVDLRRAQMDDGDTQRILVGRTGDVSGYVNTLMVLVRKTSVQYEAQAWARTDTAGWATTDWIQLREGATNGLGTLQVDWRSASSTTLADGHVILQVEDGDSSAERDLANEAQIVERLDLGLVEKFDSSDEGTFVFDLFEVYRH